jgi:diguanylate cyclase (GGDEF)-like protein
MFFIADFCNIRLHRLLVKLPLVLTGCVFAVLIWTTQAHGLIYTGYTLVTRSSTYLMTRPGPGYFVIGIFTGLCMICSLVFIIITMRKQEDKYRKQLLIILGSCVIPFATEGLYYAANLVMGKMIYFTPYAIAFMNILFYLGVVRYDIFKIISSATMEAVHHFNEGFILVDRDGKYLSSNAAAAGVFPAIAGLSRGDPILSLEGWPDALPTLDTARVDFSVKLNLPPGVESEVPLLQERHYRISVSPFIDDGTQQAKIILIQDITDTVVLMKELEDAAYTDFLTGLYNRRHFYELAAMTVERSRRSHESLYAAMIDLDLFKHVNDTYGHAAGDLTLKTAAGIIRQTLRAYDLVGRYGGEEFVVLLTGSDDNGVRQLLERIRKNMAATVINFGEEEIRITFSIGYAKFLEDVSLENAVIRADAAMYEAKKAGRDKVILYE